MLFTATILLVVGYTMVYSAMHGHWQFWQYFFPQTAPAPLAGVAAPAAPAAA